jgi:hypothetical protein
MRVGKLQTFNRTFLTCPGGGAVLSFSRPDVIDLYSLAPRWFPVHVASRFATPKIAGEPTLSRLRVIQFRGDSCCPEVGITTSKQPRRQLSPPLLGIS